MLGRGVAWYCACSRGTIVTERVAERVIGRAAGGRAAGELAAHIGEDFGAVLGQGLASEYREATGAHGWSTGAPVHLSGLLVVRGDVVVEERLVGVVHATRGG